jgi:Icc-related predicted phosphoesterase
MKITALTDLHGKLSILPAFSPVLKESDLVILTGDNTHFGHYREMQAIIKSVRQFNPNLFAVSGTCDYPDGEQSLIEDGINLNGCIREFMGLHFAGISGSLPCPGTTPHEYSEDEFRITIDSIIPQIRYPYFLVTHQPPFRTKNDRVAFGLHVGSKAIRRFIEETSPLLCFTGHIHEGSGIDVIGQTKTVNPGPAKDGYYASLTVEEGIIKDLRIERVN